MSKVKLGLALGAGGAKGLAHIGFLEILKENNIQVDFVSGSSMGSLIGSMFAIGVDFNLMKDQLDTLKTSNLVDFDLLFFRRLSLAKGRKMQAMIRSILGNRSFEDCNIPFCCTAVDLISGKGIVLNKGPLWKSVIASCSVPSAFPPVEYENMLLVDGGVYDRVPTHQCYDLGANLVIGVDVVGVPALLKNPPKNIIDIIARTFDIMDYNLTVSKKNNCDLMVTIQQDDVDSLAVRNLRVSYEAGRKAGQENIENIKALLEKKNAE